MLYYTSDAPQMREQQINELKPHKHISTYLLLYHCTAMKPLKFQQ